MSVNKGAVFSITFIMSIDNCLLSHYYIIDSSNSWLKNSSGVQDSVEKFRPLISVNVSWSGTSSFSSFLQPLSTSSSNSVSLE